MNNNDNMDYKKTAKELGMKKDYKLKFTAMGVWWFIGILFCLVFLSLFARHWSFLVRLAVAVPAGLVLMLGLYYFIFPIMNRERNYLETISQKYNSEGMSHSLAAEIDGHLRVTSFNEYNRNYYNLYLRMLTLYNLNMMNYLECMRLLDLVDMQQLQEMYSFTSGKQEMVSHHHLRLLTASLMGDLQMLEYFYGNASPLFHECRGINKLVDGMIDEALAMREIAHGRLDNAERIMQPYVNEPVVRQDYCTIVGRCAALRGDKEAAGKLFDEAYSLAKSDFQREAVQRERDSLSV